MDRAAKIVPLVSAALMAVGLYYILKKPKQTNNTSNIDMDNEGKKIPRGYRNNNPCNIRKVPGAAIWQGEVLPNTDGSFVQFKSKPYGYRAAFQTIRTYKNKYGIDTVSAIISRYAPNNENNTAGYINRVCSITGFIPGTVINPYNKEQMSKLIYAMAIVENTNDWGYNPIPDVSEIEEGWRLL